MMLLLLVVVVALGVVLDDDEKAQKREPHQSHTLAGHSLTHSVALPLPLSLLLNHSSSLTAGNFFSLEEGAR